MRVVPSLPMTPQIGGIFLPRSFCHDVLDQRPGFSDRVEVAKNVIVSAGVTAVMSPNYLVSLLRLHSLGVWWISEDLGDGNSRAPGADGPWDELTQEAGISWHEIQESSLILGARVISVFQWGDDDFIVIWSQTSSDPDHDTDIMDGSGDSRVTFAVTAEEYSQQRDL